MTKSIYTFPSYDKNSRILSSEVVDLLSYPSPAKLRYWLSILQQVKRMRHRRFGICSAMTRIQIEDRSFSYYISSNDIEELSRLWPYCSGVEMYPVPHPTESAWAAFTNTSVHGKMWDRRTTYGKLRHDLLGWMIHQLKTYLVYYLHDRHALHQNRGA